MNYRLFILLVACQVAALSCCGAGLRIGLIGLDTSHVIAFTQLLNDSKNKDYVPGGRVVAGFRGGSPISSPASAAWMATPNSCKTNSSEDCRDHRSALPAGGRRHDRERRWPPPSGAGAAGVQGRQADVY